MFLCCLFLSGCVKTADRIYTVCRIDRDGTVYAYNAENSFVKSYEGHWIETQPYGLVASPALKPDVRPGDYTFTYKLPHCYECSYRDVMHYLSKLERNCVIDTISVLESSSSLLDLNVTGQDVDGRIIYTEPGVMRVYFQDKFSKPVDTPYFNESDKRNE